MPVGLLSDARATTIEANQHCSAALPNIEDEDQIITSTDMKRQLDTDTTKRASELLKLRRDQKRHVHQAQNWTDSTSCKKPATRSEVSVTQPGWKPAHGCSDVTTRANSSPCVVV